MAIRPQSCSKGVDRPQAADEMAADEQYLGSGRHMVSLFLLPYRMPFILPVCKGLFGSAEMSGHFSVFFFPRGAENTGGSSSL